MNITKRILIALALASLSYIASAQTIATIAGSSTAGFSGDGGPGINATLNAPGSICTDGAGNIYVADNGNNRIRKITTDGNITTVAGNGGPLPGAVNIVLGDNGPAIDAQVYAPRGVAVDAAGNIYVSTFDNRIRKVTTDGIIHTIAGSGLPFFSGDGGPATSAGISYGGLAVDAAGNVYLADSIIQRVRKITPGGTISTVAGNGNFGFSGDGGAATSAMLSFGGAGAVSVDAGGNLYIVDAGNFRIRKVTTGGAINSVAGNGISLTLALTGGHVLGDGGPATRASLLPLSVAIDTAGNLFIADGSNFLIRKVTPAGIIGTIAGNGNGGLGYTGPNGDGGPALSAAVIPVGVALDPAGNLYLTNYFLSGTINGVAAPGDNRVREIPGVGATGAGGGTLPAINAGGIINGASFSVTQPPSAGSIASLFGTNLAIQTIAATTLPLPTSLGGVSVTVNGTLAPLFFVSVSQINFVLPWEVQGKSSASVSVTNRAGPSPAVTLNLGSAGPGIFTIDSSGKGQGAIQIANSTIFAAPAGSIPGVTSRPANRGEFIAIYCSGLGPVGNQPATGAAASGSPLSAVTGAVAANIGGQTALVSFAGLAPGFVGLYQVNAQVPQNVTPGSAVLVTLGTATSGSNAVTIAVQ